MNRLVHSLQEGQNVEIRGPIPTFAIKPQDFDRIVMISTGTGIAPFLQLLSRIPRPEASDAKPDFHLVHLQPRSGKEDWAEDSGLIASLRRKYGQKLSVHRPPPGPISQQLLRDILPRSSASDRIMVLVCLPPQCVFIKVVVDSLS